MKPQAQEVHPAILGKNESGTSFNSKVMNRVGIYEAIIRLQSEVHLSLGGTIVSV